MPTFDVVQGRIIIIKDESGQASTNPITVQGTIDNDAGGFILQMNNGAIQMIYRNGWRII
jgi:dUTPase